MMSQIGRKLEKNSLQIDGHNNVYKTVRLYIRLIFNIAVCANPLFPLHYVVLAGVLITIPRAIEIFFLDQVTNSAFKRIMKFIASFKDLTYRQFQADPLHLFNKFMSTLSIITNFVRSKNSFRDQTIVSVDKAITKYFRAITGSDTNTV